MEARAHRPDILPPEHLSHDGQELEEQDPFAGLNKEVDAALLDPSIPVKQRGEEIPATAEDIARHNREIREAAEGETSMFTDMNTNIDRSTAATTALDRSSSHSKKEGARMLGKVLKEEARATAHEKEKKVQEILQAIAKAADAKSVHTILTQAQEAGLSVSSDILPHVDTDRTLKEKIRAGILADLNRPIPQEPVQEEVADLTEEAQFVGWESNAGYLNHARRSGNITPEDEAQKAYVISQRQQLEQQHATHIPATELPTQSISQEDIIRARHILEKANAKGFFKKLFGEKPSKDDIQWATDILFPTEGPREIVTNNTEVNFIDPNEAEGIKRRNTYLAQDASELKAVQELKQSQKQGRLKRLFRSIGIALGVTAGTTGGGNVLHTIHESRKAQENAIYMRQLLHNDTSGTDVSPQSVEYIMKPTDEQITFNAAETTTVPFVEANVGSIVPDLSAFPILSTDEYRAGKNYTRTDIVRTLTPNTHIKQRIYKKDGRVFAMVLDLKDTNNPDTPYWTAIAKSDDGQTFHIEALGTGSGMKGTISPEFRAYLQQFREKVNNIK